MTRKFTDSSGKMLAGFLSFMKQQKRPSDTRNQSLVYHLKCHRIHIVAKLDTSLDTPSPAVGKEYRRKGGEIRPNSDYLEHKLIHRQQYNPIADWYQWQPQRTGRNKLDKQNDIAYDKHVKRIHGLHEQHLAEELHRHQEFSTQYTDHRNKTISIDPSVPPTGDKKFDLWDADRFSAMWLYWIECFPAHAFDINRELYISTKEKRIPWWDLKHISRTTSDIGSTQSSAGHTPKSTRKKEYRMLIDPDRNAFELTFLSIPCRICGSGTHPALRGAEDDYGEITYKYVCRCAAHDNWELESMRACPHKLAQSCDLSPKKVEDAIRLMSERGWGQHLSKRTLKIFEAQALQHCETDSEDEDIDKEYEQIQANIALSHNEQVNEENYRTPERQSPHQDDDNPGASIDS